jgi:ABC-type Mn2+/Zn2+ transport system ATPase subunit
LVSHDIGLVSEQTEEVVCVNRKVVKHPAHEMSSEIVESMFGGAGALLVDHGHVHTERGEPRG